MHTIDPKTPLLALHGTPIRRVAVDWRDTLRTVGTIAQRTPGMSINSVLEQAARAISDAESVALTLGDAVIDALLTGKAAEECMGRDKLRRWELAVKFKAGDPVDVLPADVVFIEACLAELYKPAVYGPARDALNGVTR
jgi:hypothetical protein